MTVVFSPVAETDLEEIGDYIALANPRRAVTFVREIRDRCNTIAGAPEAAPSREDIGPGIRMQVHGNYLVFYRMQVDVIRIERILHGAQDVGAAFDKKRPG